MEAFKIFQVTVALSTLLIISANGQIGTPCTSSITASLTPCMNFVTGSINGRALSSSCCDTLQSIMTTNSACACLILTGNVPLPFIQTIANTLPQACNMGSSPLQCQATATPLPPAGRPFLLGPTAAPVIPPALAPTASAAPAHPPAPSPLAS